MKKDIYIIGASGFGREVAWLLEENEEWNILGFIDDNQDLKGKIINHIPVIGGMDYLKNFTEKINVVIAIGNPRIREKIFNELKNNENLIFPNIIGRNVKMSKYINMGKGNIICEGNILTTNINIGDFNHINLSCTIGHDVIIENYITVYPGVNISGNVKIGNNSEIGTGSKIIQGKNISSDIIIGAGSVIVKDLCEKGTYVGVPVKKIK